MMLDFDKIRSTSELKPRVSLLKLEQYLLNELSSPQRAQLEKDMDTHPDLKEYVESLRHQKSTLNWSRVAANLPKPEKKTEKPTLLARMENWISQIPDPFQNKLGWATSFAMILLSVTALVVTLPEKSGMRTKGGSTPEIILEVGGRKITSGQIHHVQSGEIVTFGYRSSEPLYAQFWYAEDNNPLALFEGKDNPTLLWPASSGWGKPPQRIRLEGNWKRQRILVLTSHKIFSAEEAQRVLTRSESATGPIQVFAYDFVQP